ncbi:GNAT family N-acetyltransferase [Herpetosiphon sp. NSE202]|uniref:GNAT family N-acetyltransferase n=1 Tax=Herpetosiphon sp. NSE202 TaxID=3351349 RepID=UPI00362D7DAC
MFKYDLDPTSELRILERRHAPAFLELVSTNRQYFGEWLGWANTMTTVADAEAFIAAGLTRFAEDGLPRVGIWHNQQLVGGMLFFPLDRRLMSTEIGYWLAESAGGQGLMVRATRALLEFVFDQLGLNRIGLNAVVENKRSRVVADRLGFTLEGVRRQTWTDGKRFADMACYSLLASEWRSQHHEINA